MNQHAYHERLKAIAAAAYLQPAAVWLLSYLKFRGDCLLGELRRSDKDSFETIQGRLDENDHLMQLIKAIEEVNTTPPE